MTGNYFLLFACFSLIRIIQHTFLWRVLYVAGSPVSLDFELCCSVDKADFQIRSLSEFCPNSSFLFVRSVGAGPTGTLFTSVFQSFNANPPLRHWRTQEFSADFLLLRSWKFLFYYPSLLMICIMNITQRNSVILMHFVIFVFSIEAIHRTVHFHTPALSSSVLWSRPSLAFLNIPDSLCFHG